MKVYKLNIPRHEWNLLKQRFRRLQNYIMFFVEERFMLNIIARGTMEQRIQKGNISRMNLLDEKSFDKIAESAKTCLWFRNIRISVGGLILVFENVVFSLCGSVLSQYKSTSNNASRQFGDH